MEEKPKSIDQIAYAFKEINSQLFNYGADLANLTLLLVQKGVLTRDEITAGKDKLLDQMKEKGIVADANPQDPSEGVH